MKRACVSTEAPTYLHALSWRVELPEPVGRVRFAHLLLVREVDGLRDSLDGLAIDLPEVDGLVSEDRL